LAAITIFVSGITYIANTLKSSSLAFDINDILITDFDSNKQISIRNGANADVYVTSLLLENESFGASTLITLNKRVEVQSLEAMKLRRRPLHVTAFKEQAYSDPKVRKKYGLQLVYHSANSSSLDQYRHFFKDKKPRELQALCSLRIVNLTSNEHFTKSFSCLSLLARDKSVPIQKN